MVPKPVVRGVVPVRVVLPNAVVRRAARSVVYASLRRLMGAPAQPAHAVDAATRPQDRCFFETENRSNVFPIDWWRRN